MTQPVDKSSPLATHDKLRITPPALNDKLPIFKPAHNVPVNDSEVCHCSRGLKAQALGPPLGRPLRPQPHPLHLGLDPHPGPGNSNGLRRDLNP